MLIFWGLGFLLCDRLLILPLILADDYPDYTNNFYTWNCDFHKHTSGVHWQQSLDTPQAQEHLIRLSPAIRRHLAIDIIVNERWLPAVRAVADIFGFRSLSIRVGLLGDAPPDVLPAVAAQLATGLMAAAGTAATQVIRLASFAFDPYPFRTAAAFANVARVRLGHCIMLKDVTALGCATHVELFGGYALKDVSALAAVRHVLLHNCPRLRDATALAKVQELELSLCPKLKHVSTLGDAAHKKLTLRSCPALSDVSRVGNLSSLTIIDCERVDDVSGVTGVVELVLTRCGPKNPVSGVHALRGLGSLRGVAKLTLTAVSVSSADVDGLNGSDTLEIFENNELVELTGLANIGMVWIDGCQNLQVIGALSGVRRLDVSRCYAVQDVSRLGAVHSLELTCCEILTDVSALGGVDTLSLSYCYEVVDVSALGAVRKLDLTDCRKVVDASALGGVTYLTLTGTGVRDYSALDRVPHLRK